MYGWTYGCTDVREEFPHKDFIEHQPLWEPMPKSRTGSIPSVIGKFCPTLYVTNLTKSLTFGQELLNGTKPKQLDGEGDFVERRTENLGVNSEIRRTRLKNSTICAKKIA
jgi:hypothetical protein